MSARRKKRRGPTARGKRLRELREAAGLSQVEFARQVGRANTTAWRWEKKGVEPDDLDTIKRICAVLRCTIEDLEPRDEPMAPAQAALRQMALSALPRGANAHDIQAAIAVLAAVDPETLKNAQRAMLVDDATETTTRGERRESSAPPPPSAPAPAPDPVVANVPRVAKKRAWTRGR